MLDEKKIYALNYASSGDNLYKINLWSMMLNRYVNNNIFYYSITKSQQE